MCGLCGALGRGDDWTDAAGRREFEEGGRKVVRRLERAQRVALVDAVIRPQGLSIRDWGGNSYILCGRRGVTRNVYNLAGIWSEVDGLTEVNIDPLDDALLTELEGGAQ